MAKFVHSLYCAILSLVSVSVCLAATMTDEFSPCIHPPCPPPETCTEPPCSPPVNSLGDQQYNRYPVGDIHNCPAYTQQNPSQPLYLMDVLPGGGYDSLRDLDMGQVHFYNYSTCKISNDGKYLLPDNVFLIPIKQSRSEVFAEYFDHWDNYTSTTSTSFKAGMKGSIFGGSVSASFSYEHTHVKTHQVEDKAKTTRVQLRHTMYSVKLQPDSELHPTFKNRLFDIAANMQNNNSAYAEYLAEVLVRDYGTHFLSSSDAGAVLYRIDHVNSNFVGSSDAQRTNVTASASASFFGVTFYSSASHSSSSDQTEAYVKSLTHSQVYSAGGPNFSPNMTIREWEEGVPDNLVTIDRMGDPLYYAINTRTIPELPETAVGEVEDAVYRAIHRYYKVNTRHGCTSPGFYNFDFQANVDDGSCGFPPETNVTLGGVYQTCELVLNNLVDICTSGSKPVAQKNPLTNDYSCPDGFQAILLHSGTTTVPSKYTECREVPYKCFWLFTCHKKVCSSRVVLNMANYQAFWCAGSSHDTGFYFGGIYTSTMVNPKTDSMSCPAPYVPLHFGEDVEVCVSDDLEKAYNASVPFGGFESCKTGNPLAASRKHANNSHMWPHSCPRGFIQRLVAVDEGCDISICVKPESFNRSISLLAAQLPPFRKRPSYKSNITNTFAILDVRGDLWLKKSSGVFEKINSTLDDGYDVLTSSAFDEFSDEAAENEGGGGSGDSLSNAVVAVISVISTLVFCTIIALALLSANYLRKKKIVKSRSGNEEYLRINETANVETSGPGESNM